MRGLAVPLILALAVVFLLPSGATLQEETTILPRPVETPTAEPPTAEVPTAETPAAAEAEPAILPVPTPSIDWSSLGPFAPLRWDRGTSQTSQPLAADPS